jgi:hypothetical protein
MRTAKHIPDPATGTSGDEAELGRQAYDLAEQLCALASEMEAWNWPVQKHSLEHPTEGAQRLHRTSIGEATSSGSLPPAPKIWPQNRRGPGDHRQPQMQSTPGLAVHTVRNEGALGEMSGHALHVSRRLYALVDRLVALSWGVEGYTMAQLREMAGRLHSTSMRAALACGSAARVHEATGLSLSAPEIDLGTGEVRAAPAADSPPAETGFAGEEVAQWVADVDLSDPWHQTLPGMADDLVILRADRDRLQSELDQLRTATA